MTSKCRRYLAAAWSLLFLSQYPTASAEEYPVKSVHVLVGFAAGGPTDMLARLVGERLSQKWRQPVQAKPLYDIERDLTPVVGIARQGNVLVVNPSVPARTPAELITYLKSMSGKVSYASGGSGSPAHVAGELFKLMAGVDMQHVPYKGAAPALQDVVAGHVALMFAAAPPALSLVKSGKLRALAVTSDARMAQLPDLPALAEAGITYDVRDWQGLVAPSGTPEHIVRLVNADVREILDSPAFQARVASLGGEPAGGTPSDFADHIKSEAMKWRKVVKEANISIN